MFSSVRCTTLDFLYWTRKLCRKYYADVIVIDRLILYDAPLYCGPAGMRLLPSHITLLISEAKRIVLIEDIVQCY